MNSFRTLPSVARLRVGVVVIGWLLAAAWPVPADVLDDWNDAMLDAIRRENTPPPLAARSLAMVHLAIYRAIVTVTAAADAPGHSYPEAVVASAAADRTFRMLYPSQVAALGKLRKSGPAWDEGGVENGESAAIGVEIADALLDTRAGDETSLSLTYQPSAVPGAWRRTLPYFRPPELPHWGHLKPFVINSPERFLPPPPPALESDNYATDFNEVKRLGALHSAARTTYETETAKFWSDFSGTVTPPGHWNQIARVVANNKGLGLREKAHLLALLNLALADAGIVCWQAKYRYNFWRPVTAIRRAAADGNSGTEPDPEWEPLLVTPAFPEYVSGHSTFGGAGGEILRRFFGRDDVNMEVSSDSLPGVIRHYDSFTAVSEEIGRSRIYGGIHFPSADRAGQAAGRAVAQRVFESGLGSWNTK